MTAEQRGEANVPPDQREQSSTSTERPDEGTVRREEAEDEPETEPGTESTGPDGTEDAYADHLSEVPDGSGCTEIWEHLSEEREDDD